MRAKPLRWSRPRHIGFAGPMYLELRRDGVRLATVQAHDKGGGWFWYGGGVNTAGQRLELEDAKRAAKAHIRAMEAA